ncbi:DNA-directed RNA polymerase subunit D [Methanocalculus taiwanensis]|uniref:DNA-directed RNA polymerase subunit Rpo3 n=1 Tax=Methanocalculus taiwanensis TaxID=106207 RepID=A0ABD4TII2_9EURY|nr:DNA-directed RNA polymerase subunit D [Methanocalculus taiwanensis]MCQ1538501.1 DNA-directed RNA polymerase subunit D [Methanocalculus taiwanensis]
MEIVFGRLDDSIARFTLSGASEAFANALRRSMIGEVPTLAIEDVRIYDNTSVLFDEMLAHRIGMIPIKTDLSRFVRREACKCEGAGCPHCQVTFTLTVEGPGMVTSGDLVSEDPMTVPVDTNIPLVKLWEDQKLVIEAVAYLNTGTEHAKWQSTIACGYKQYPVIEVTDQCDGCGMCVDECPRNVLEVKGQTVRVVEGKIEACSLCKLCEKACIGTGIGEDSAINIDSDRTKYLFIVESDGSIPAQQIIEEGLRYIRKRSDEIIESLQEISMEGQ